MSVSKGRGLLYRLARLLGDWLAVSSGSGKKMVKASLKNLPNDWKVALVFDWSSGFWDKMEQKYNHAKWLRI